MGFRYRKSIKLGPVMLKFSKKGIDIGISVKGTRAGVGPRGVRNTLSVPGTVAKKTSKKTSVKQLAHQKAKSGQTVRTKISRPYKGARWLVGASIGILMLGGTKPGFGILITVCCGAIYYVVRKRLERQSVA